MTEFRRMFHSIPLDNQRNPPAEYKPKQFDSESAAMTAPHILLAGLFHETQTFLDGSTPLADFAIRSGDELFTARDDGSPLSGVLEVGTQAGWRITPSIDLRATPSATVEDEVLETFWARFEQDLMSCLAEGLDGIYLVLHGAMTCVSYPDVEGEILGRLRNVPGCESLPVCGVLDLHGNISPDFAEATQAFVAYQCNPHTDARQAAVRGAQLLDRIVHSGQQPVTVWAQPAVVWPPTGTGTDDDPMRTLERLARELEQQEPEIDVVNVFGGFAFADTEHTGVSLMAITTGDPQAARDHLARICDWAWDHRAAGNVVDQPLETAMQEIVEALPHTSGPILIVEPSDNIGGGAPGDGTSALRALIRHQIDNAAVVINDPQAVQQLQTCQPGQQITLNIGGRGSSLAEGPVELELELESTSDGRFELEDIHSHLASMNGIQIDMGPSAVVRHAGIRILLTSRKTPPFDLGQLRSQGIIPEDQAVIVVKAAVAHRRAFDPIAAKSYTVSTPGPCCSDLSTFPFTKLRRPVFPLDDA